MIMIQNIIWKIKEPVSLRVWKELANVKKAYETRYSVYEEIKNTYYKKKSFAIFCVSWTVKVDLDQ